MPNYKTDKSRDILIDNKWTLEPSPSVVPETSPRNLWDRTKSSKMIKMQIPGLHPIPSAVESLERGSEFCVLTTSRLLSVNTKV